MTQSLQFDKKETISRGVFVFVVFDLRAII